MTDKSETTNDDRTADKDFEQVCSRLNDGDLQAMRRFLETVRRHSFDAGRKLERQINEKF